MLKIYINNITSLIEGQLEPLILNQLSTECSFIIQGSEFSPLFQSGHWNGAKKLFNIRKQTFPTGLLSRIRKILDINGLKYEIIDSRIIPTISQIPLYPPGPIRPYQEDSIKTAIERTRGVIKVGTGGGKCIKKDSLVFTSEGLIEIGEFGKELKDTEHAPLAKTIYGREGLEVTSHILNEGVRDTIRLKTKYGYEIEGTREHPLLVFDSLKGIIFKKLKDICKKDIVCIQRDQQCFGNSLDIKNDIGIGYNNEKIYSLPDKLTLGICRIFGYLVAEGSFNTDRIIGFTNEDKEIAEDFNVNFKKYFGKEFKKTSNPINYVLYSTQIKRFFKLHQLNGLSKDKVMPSCILQAPKKYMAEFLRAYFEGDGTIENSKSKGIVSITTSSEKLARQLQTALLNFGVVSRRYARRRCATNGKKIYRQYWTIYIGGKNVEIFAKEIGFAGKSKTKRLNNILGRYRNTNTDIIPFIKKFLIELRAKHIIDNNDKLYRRLNKAREKDRCTYELLNEVKHLIKNDLITEILQKRYFFDTVIELTPSKAQVFDFTVPGSHSFTSNGFINHNSFIMAGIASNTNLPTLVVTHTSSVFEQTIKNFENYLKIPIGRIGAGEKKIEKVTVALIQSLTESISTAKPQYIATLIKKAKPKKKIIARPELLEYLASIDCLISDECHHCSTDSIQAVSEACTNAYYRFGVSATPFRDDLADILIECVTGKRIIDYSASYLIKRDYLSKPTIHLVPFIHHRQPKSLKYKDLYTQEVVENKSRNDLVCRIARKYIDAGKSVLISVQRIRHGELIEADLKSTYGDKVRFANGEDNADALYQTLQDLNTKKLIGVVASSVFKEGVDVPNLDALICAAAYDSTVASFQLVGRALRRTATKNRVDIFDICDSGCRYLSSHSNSRIEIYQTEPEYILVEGE